MDLNGVEVTITGVPSSAFPATFTDRAIRVATQDLVVGMTARMINGHDWSVGSVTPQSDGSCRVFIRGYNPVTMKRTVTVPPGQWDVPIWYVGDVPEEEPPAEDPPVQP